MPQAIASAVVSFFGLTGTTAAVVSAAVQVAVIAGANAVVANNSKEKPQGGLIDLQLNSAAPRQLVIGKRMVGGTLVDWYLAGSNNTHLHLPTYLCEGPCGTITRIFADGREVFSTPLVHGVRTAIPDFRSGGDRLFVTYYDGRAGQTADPTLVALGQGWTTDNKMTGCAYVIVECWWDSDNMRSPPQLSFEMEGAKLYDRRKDTTAGGSGSHRLDNPATWEWTDNPAVALDHFMLGRYIGGVKTFGIGLTAEEVPYDRFAAQANVCDEDVDLKAGGTQKRYRANGFMFANEDYASTITKLCTAMAARPADFGGQFGVIGIESRTPVMSIDDDELIVGAEEVYTPKRTWGEMVGAIEGRYQDPAQLYQPVDYPRIVDAAWDEEDGGEPKVLTLDLEFETNVERAQRLATLKARAERRQATLRGVYPLKTIELERGDWFIRIGDKWGVDGKTFEVLERILSPDAFTVAIVAQEVDAADSAWDESVASDGPPAPLDSTDTLSDVAAPSLTVTSNPIVGAASNTPAIKVVFANPTDPRVKQLFVEVYRQSDGLKVATDIVNIPDDDELTVIQNGIADGVAYDVRARFLTPSIYSGWSTTVAVTTGATYAVGAATSVPWTGVTTRPANLSALAGTENINNILVPVGQNAAVNSEFVAPGTYPPTGWESGSNQTAGATTRTIITAGPRNVIQARNDGTPTTGQIFDALRQPTTFANLKKYALPVNPGDRIAASVLIAHNSAVTSAAAVIAYWDAAGNFVSGGPTMSTVTNVADGSTGDPANFALSSGVATVPATAKFASLITARATCNGGANPTVWTMSPLLARIPANQTTVPTYTPASPDRLSDLTSANTAAAITGQAAAATDATIQAGATKNSVTYSSSAPGSPTNGDLWADTTTTPIVWKIRVSGAWQTVSSLGGVFGSTLLETAGGTVASLAAFKTLLGIASGITSQGTQATANAQRGSSYSGTPVEGSWWADTGVTPNKLKFYTGGAWQIVATLVSDAVATALTASFSPANVNTTHTTSTPLNQAVTATPAGGSGSYTYVWAVSNVYEGATPTLSGQYTATCTIDVTHTAIGTIDGLIQCTITDTVTGKSIVKYWGYYSQGTGGGGGAGGGDGLPP